MTLPAFFTHSLYIERTVYNGSLTWGEWLQISSVSKKTREVVLTIKPFQVFVIGRLMISRIVSYQKWDGDLWPHRDLVTRLELLRARIGDFAGVEDNIAFAQDQLGDLILSYWAGKWAKLALFYANSPLDYANAHAVRVVAKHLDIRNIKSCIFPIIEALLNKGDADSMKLALEFAEKLDQDSNHYSLAIRKIAFAKLKNPTKETLEEAKQLAGKKIYPTTSLIIQCQIAYVQSINFLELITERYKTNPSSQNINFIFHLLQWRLDNHDSNSLEDCIEICKLASTVHVFKHLYFLVSDKTDDENELAQIRERLRSELPTRNLNEHELEAGTNSRIPLALKCSQSSVDMERLFEADPEKLRDELLKLLAQSTRVRFTPDLIKNIMRLDVAAQECCFIKLLENLPDLTFTGITNPFELHGILFSSHDVARMDYRAIITHIVLSETQS